MERGGRRPHDGPSTHGSLSNAHEGAVHSPLVTVRTVLFIGASISQLAAIRQARHCGLRVVAVDGDPDAVGLAAADRGEAIDFSDLESVVEVGRREAVDAVVAISSDRAVPVAAMVAERLGLPGIGVETALRMTDKGAMRRSLHAGGIRQPRFEIVKEVHGAAIPTDIFPAVVKPVDSGGQRGVFIVRDPAELAGRLPEALAYSRTGRVIVEQYVEGAELNGIIVVRSGRPQLLTLSDRLRPPGPGFGVGWIHLYPSRLEPSALEAAEAVALDAVRALGLRDGIAFPQLLVADQTGDVLVVEVAARIPAGQMADLVRVGTGIDLIDIALRQALGDDVPDDLVEPAFSQPLAIRFLTASPGFLPTGIVTEVSGLDEVRNSPGVVDAGLYIELGEEIRPVQVDLDRRGYVIAVADDSEAALELANQAARNLVVLTVPIPDSASL